MNVGKEPGHIYLFDPICGLDQENDGGLKDRFVGSQIKNGTFLIARIPQKEHVRCAEEAD